MKIFVRACVTATVTFAAVTVNAQSNLPSGPTIAYFASDWCPAEFQHYRLRNISHNYYVKQGTCCLDRIELPEGFTLEKLAEQFPDAKVSLNPDTSTCTGYRPSESEAQALLAGSVSYAELKAVGQRREQEEQARREEKARRDFSLELEARSDAWLCATFGRALRHELPGDPIAEVQREMRKRKVVADAVLARKGTFKMGQGVCQVFAALGVPDDSNRTVTARSTRVQYVFRRGARGTVYVYTEGERVVAWQD